MKKILALVLTLCLFIPVLAMNVSADEVGIKAITFESTEAGVVKSVPQGGGTLDVLIDGEFIESATTWEVNGIVLFQNTHCTTEGEYPTFSLILELDSTANLSGAALTFFKYYGAMIGLPKDNEIIVEISKDGSDFELVDSYTFEGEAVSGEIAFQTVELDIEGSAKFVKFTFAYGDSPFTADNKIIWEWISFTEIEIFADNTIIEVPSETEESQEPTSSKESSGTTTTPTGDSNAYIALAVIAVITLAGAVVVKKSR